MREVGLLTLYFLYSFKIPYIIFLDGLFPTLFFITVGYLMHMVTVLVDFFFL